MKNRFREEAKRLLKSGAKTLDVTFKIDLKKACEPHDLYMGLDPDELHRVLSSAHLIISYYKEMKREYKIRDFRKRLKKAIKKTLERRNK
jgi:hypothetical protein